MSQYICYHVHHNTVPSGLYSDECVGCNHLTPHPENDYCICSHTKCRDCIAIPEHYVWEAKSKALVLRLKVEGR